jgi:hypothetical protein
VHVVYRLKNIRRTTEKVQLESVVLDFTGQHVL